MHLSATTLLLGFSACAAVSSVVAAPVVNTADSVTHLKRQDSGNGTDTGSDGSNGFNGTDIALQEMNTVTTDFQVVTSTMITSTNDLGVLEASTLTLLSVMFDPSVANTSIIAEIQDQTASNFQTLLSDTQTLLANVSATMDAINVLGKQLVASGILDDDGDDQSGGDDGNDGQDGDVTDSDADGTDSNDDILNGLLAVSQFIYDASARLAACWYDLGFVTDSLNVVILASSDPSASPSLVSELLADNALNFEFLLLDTQFLHANVTGAIQAINDFGTLLETIGVPIGGGDDQDGGDDDNDDDDDDNN